MSMKSMYEDLSGQYHIHAGTARNYGYMKALTSIFYLIYLFVCLHCLKTRGMLTIIRDANTSKHDFIFYADRLIRLVCTDLYQFLNLYRIL